MGPYQISWNTSDAQTVSLRNLTTSSLIATGLPASGTLTRTMTSDTTFRLTATSAQNLVAEADCTVNVLLIVRVDGVYFSPEGNSWLRVDCG